MTYTTIISMIAPDMISRVTQDSTDGRKTANTIAWLCSRRTAGNSRDESGDAYRAEDEDLIGHATVPSTDSYQGGIVYPTDNTIRAISTAGTTMEFDFDAPVAPASPRNLSIASVDGVSVTLAWDANSPIPDGYRVFVRTEGQAQLQCQCPARHSHSLHNRRPER